MVLTCRWLLAVQARSNPIRIYDLSAPEPPGQVAASRRQAIAPVSVYVINVADAEQAAIIRQALPPELRDGHDQQSARLSEDAATIPGPDVGGVERWR